LGDEQEQVAFCERIKTEGLSVRATEQMVQDQILAADAGPEDAGPEIAGSTTRHPRIRSQHLKALEQELRESLGAKVSIRESAKGRGKIVIDFSSRDEFERVRSLLAPLNHSAIARAG
jgi:ParB family chromosome partitioning protein